MDISERTANEDNRVPFIVYEGTIARSERTVRRVQNIVYKTQEQLLKHL